MKKKQIVFLSIFLITIGIFFLFERKTEIKETKNNKNIELAIYINEEETNTIPSKESGYYYDREKSSCTNGAYINWDSISWSPVVSNMNEYKTRCELHFTTTYTEGILNGTDPVLEDPLIPVIIESDGTVKKADLESEWYSYANKEWANAVILKESYTEEKLIDLSGNENDAILMGPTITEEGLSFDGIDDVAKIPNLDWEDSKAFTIEFTAKIDSSDDSYTNIYSTLFESSADSNKNYNSFYINTREYGNNDIQIAMKNFENSNLKNHKASDNIIDSNNYVTYTVTFNSTNKYNDFIHIYKNGLNQNVQVANLENSTRYDSDITGFSLENYDFFIGARGDGAEIPTKMILKELKIYTKELTQEEIQKNYNNDTVLDHMIVWYDLTNRNYKINETIPEGKIESYFVWLPKYRYQLWDLGIYDSLTEIDTSKVHEIPIIFGDYNTSDDKIGECTTPMESGATGNCKVGDYMTHPAFLSIPSTGFWVGKFETGYNGATSQSEAEQNVNDSSKIIVKPNVHSWRGIQVANAFYSSYNYQRNLDSHMMKNTEWGVVAYLQHSAYGSSTSIRINNNSD